MLSRALAENQNRAARVEKLMKEIIVEGNILTRIEKKIALSEDDNEQTVASGLLEECQRHKRRMATILREADELMKESLPINHFELVAFCWK